MQNSVIHIIKATAERDLLDSRMSFSGFIGFLKERRLVEKTTKMKYLDFLIHHFEERLQGKDELEAEDLQQYGDLLEYMYAAVSSPLSDERENWWALSIPLIPEIVYGTDSFYDLLLDPKTRQPRAVMMEGKEPRHDELNIELVYSVILKRLYGYPFSAGNSLLRSWKNEDTGLPSFYRLNIDTRFIEVSCKGALPEFDPKVFQTYRSRDEVLSWLQEHLPFSTFRFRGFTALTVTDVTKFSVLNNIKGLLLDSSHCVHGSQQSDILRYMQILGGTTDVDFGLMPFLKVNGRPVFSGEACHHSVFAGGAEEEARVRQTGAYLEMAEKFYREPRLVLYETLPSYEEGENFFLGSLRRDGIRGYSLTPVYHNNQLVGVVELSSRKAGAINEALLMRLEEALPLLAQLFQRETDEFDDRIKAIVKENFTSIQPAVEWKFNEAAWRFEQLREMGESPVIESIFFPGVYPLYGAVDIRNSTIERNGALRRDLQTQFAILTQTLESLQQAVSLNLLDELIYQSRKWEKALEGALTTADELNLNSFLTGEAGDFLEHFSHSRPDTAELTAPYLKAVDPEEGIVFENRRNLELSIQLVNQTINQHLESAAEELRNSYPCYFEKFRTDGIEYDIYAGQSIAPDRPFDALYLHNLRLWQLNSMVAIVRLTEALSLTVPLKTTQLIFVHSAPIDISFRKDERRFDVEGGYNIRYQVVKKRIDKVHVQDTNERLTQPGMIAIIYFNEREAQEYVGYIKYLQEKGHLKEEIEYLELEELQGVSGLRALRVGVRIV